MAKPYERFSEQFGVVPNTEEHGSRSPVAKDRDRIIHCGAFRRLQRKSQIVGVQSSDFFRTRLTHTIECAQIGRGIANRSLESDLEGVVEEPEHLPDLLEAATLAHDLGHPPFGHNGEHALTRMMDQHARGLFEGNAQSFRIVTRLEPKVEAGDRWCGLDLTRTTLNAILKYPVTEDEAWQRKLRKFCIYRDGEDQAVYEWMFSGAEPDRSLATHMLEAADDIAYAVHDFEDGVWSQMIPLFQLLDEDDSSAREKLERQILSDDKKAALFAGESVETSLDRFFHETGLREAAWARGPFDRSRRARAELKNLCADLIGTFIDGVTENERFSPLPEELQRRLYLLTGMAWVWMIENPAEEAVRFGQRRLVEDLFRGFWENPAMLPHQETWAMIAGAGPSATDRELSNDPDGDPAELPIWRDKARLICDHVAGMTDLYALHAHGEMYQGGASPGVLRLR